MKIVKNEVLSEKYQRFDLSIEDTHNFLCNGVVVHNTSAHMSWKFENESVNFFAGGEKHTNFVALFDIENLKAKFKEFFPDVNVVVFGEAYGGKQQGMSKTYGDKLKFVAFDVKVGDFWLSVPNADDVVQKLSLEFVDYVKCSTSLEDLDREMNKDSVQAIRNGMGEGKLREGVVIRPLVELTMNNGERIIAKHKRPEFKETKTQREVDPSKLEVLTRATEIAEEWVVPMRLEHVVDKLGGFDNVGLEKMRDVISAMVEDVYREAKGEIIESKEVEKAIGSKAAKMFKAKKESKLREGV